MAVPQVNKSNPPTGLPGWQRRLAAGTAAGACAGAGVLLPEGNLAGATALLLLSPLPIFLAGLLAGRGAASLAVAVAGALAWIEGGGLLAAALLVPFVLPALIAVGLSLQQVGRGGAATGWPSSGLVLSALALYGGLVLAGLMAVLSRTPDGLSGLVARLAADVAAQPVDSPFAGAALLDTIAAVEPVLPGLVLSAYLLTVITCGAVAGRIASLVGIVRRPPMTLAGLGLPADFLPAFAFCGAAALLSQSWLGYLAGNMAVVLGLCYVLMGLGTIHRLAAGRPGRSVLVVTTYVFLLLFSALAIVPIAALGVITHWRSMRPASGGAAPPGPDREDR